MLICYLIYNASLLKIPIKKNGKSGSLYVDDMCLITTGKNFTVTHTKISNIMHKLEGVLKLADDHNCTFGLEKFQLLDAARGTIPHLFMARKQAPLPCPALIINGHWIESKPSIKHLGVHIDQGLWWKEQGVAVLAKGQDWLVQFGQLCQTTQGVSFKHLKRLYTSI